MTGESNVHSMDEGQIALLVIDVQQGLFERATPIYQAEPFLENVNLLIRNARRAGAPVFFVQHANKGTLTAGSQAWQLHPAIQPLAGETVIHKRHGDAFEETELQDVLAVRGVKTLVVTGLVTHGCVKATCVGALERGYRVVLVADGHSSFSKQAAALIEKWNRKLSEMGVQLKETRQISSVAHRHRHSEPRPSSLPGPGGSSGQCTG